MPDQVTHFYYQNTSHSTLQEHIVNVLNPILQSNPILFDFDCVWEFLNTWNYRWYEAQSPVNQSRRHSDKQWTSYLNQTIFSFVYENKVC